MSVLKLLCFTFMMTSLADGALKPKKHGAKVAHTKKVHPKDKKHNGHSDEKEPAEKESNILQPYGIEVNSTNALLIDYTTGKVLLEKNPNQQIEPASMTKILTAYMVMKAMKEGHIKPDSIITVSRNARNIEKGSSDMFLEIGDQVKVEEVLRGLIIVSGNDAAIALAEYLSGTQSAFSADMTHAAKEMGCMQTNFKNASGLPEDEHLSTVNDIYIMSKKTFEDFPQWYGIYKELNFTYRGIKQANRNLLLTKNIGCDGIKTGHTSRAGYGMSASAMQNGRRLFLVVAGLNSIKERAEEAYRLLEWGFTTYGNYSIAPKNATILELPVRYGVDEQAQIIAKHHVLTIQKSRINHVKASIKYEKMLVAPLAAGDQVGEVTLTHPDFKEPVVIPLIVKKDIERSFFLSRISQTIQYLFGK